MTQFSKNKIIILAGLAGLTLLLAVLLLPANPESGFKLPKSYAQALEVRAAGSNLSFIPQQARASERQQVAENKVKYIETFVQTDIELTTEKTRLKEDIILKQPGHPASFSYRLQGLEKFEVIKNADGDLEFYATEIHRKNYTEGTELNKVLTIPAPFIIDATGEKSATSEVEMKLVGDILTLTPDPDWLASHEYPIIVDPTLELEVLNINSVPTVGGPWTVQFTTLGIGDLVIQGDPDNTVYGVNVEPVSLRCGAGAELTPKLTRNNAENYYLYENWSCDEVATWSVKVLKPGHHHQTFSFHGQTAEAYNDTISNDWCSGLSSWSYRRKITLNNASQSTALENFPAAVQLSEGVWRTNIDYTKTQNSGQDIRFCDQDNATLLDYEIEKWDETATSTLWVEVPNITAASSTEHIWMYYGNAGASDNATTTGVWDENYVGVWHSHETSGTTLADSTSYANNGTKVSATEPNPIAGRIDGAQDYDGSNDYVNVSDAPSLDLTDAITITGWLSADSSVGSYIMSKPFGNSNNDAYVVKLSSLKLVLELGNGGAYKTVQGQSTLATGVWAHFAATYDKTTMRIFTNGIEDGTTAHTAAIQTNNETVRIGRYTDGSPNSFNGLIDEVRVSGIARSADWIAFEYCNSVETCNSFGAEESNLVALDSAADTPDPTNPNRSVTFTIDWSGAGPIKAKICKTDSLTSQNCDGGFWASSSAFTTDDPEKLVYDVVSGDHGQTRSYYAFVCDDAASCTPSSSGTFSVNAQSTVPNIKVRRGFQLR